MAKEHARRPVQGAETLTIRNGRLGPLKPCTLDVRPLTVLIGRQGTGKSIVAQVLYFFRGLPNLVQFDTAQRRPTQKGSYEPRDIIGRILDGLRSRHRRFANLTHPSVTVEWSGQLPIGGVHANPISLGFNTQHVTRQTQPRAPLLEAVKTIVDSKIRQPWTGVFLPTERLFYTLALGPASLHVIAAPLILEVFASWMEMAGRVQEDWPDGQPDTPQGRWIHERLRKALGGEPRRRGSAWKWRFEDNGSFRSIDLDMASSGQRANWPVMLISEALFTLKAQGELGEQFTVYVEEPEIHLHPAAERTLVEVLAYLVAHGLRVVVTTHSLTVLYTLNNLLLAKDVSDSVMREELPVDLRLAAEDVVAYHLLPNGTVATLSDTTTGLIDETALGSVADDLASQMNRLYAAKTSE